MIVNLYLMRTKQKDYIRQKESFFIFPKEMNFPLKLTHGSQK